MSCPTVWLTNGGYPPPICSQPLANYVDYHGTYGMVYYPTDCKTCFSFQDIVRGGVEPKCFQLQFVHPCVESLLFCGLGAFLSPFEVVSKSGKIIALR